MCIKQYNLDDYNRVLSNYKFKLSKEIIDIIDSLSIEVDEYIKTIPVTTNDNYDEKRKHRRNYRNNAKGSNENGWAKKEPFNATKIERKHDNEKYIEEISSVLNKITKKSYDNQRDKLFEILNATLQDDTDSDNEEQDNLTNNHVYIQITKALFDIIKRTRMGFDIYAILFKDMITRYPMFIETITEHIKNYIISYSDIHDIDPNTNYDAYCDMNKMNDKRRSMTNFIVELFKNKLLKEEELSDIITTRIEIVLDSVDTDGTTCLIEEVTENLFIFMTTIKGNVDFEDNLWKGVLDNISICSKLKAKEHKSISSRMVFKYMDITDALKR
jgi:hypothetical protein